VQRAYPRNSGKNRERPGRSVPAGREIFRACPKILRGKQVSDRTKRWGSAESLGYADRVSDDAGDTLLSRVPLFAGLDSSVLQEITRQARTRAAEARETFFEEGDPATSFFVVRSGSVKLTQLSPEGHLVVLRLLGAGEAFGGVSAFGGDTYPVTAEAITEVVALEWSGAVMASLMERHPRLSMNAVRFVAARLHDLQVRYRELATEKVERRVARALVRLVQQSGRRVEGGVLIDLPLSREDIAQMTGTTLFTVSRLMSRWEADQIVEVGRQRMVIRKPHALMSIAEDLS
jgi:CRP/FNR family transcriptional regulator, nitrogen oxide reductase regulator